MPKNLSANASSGGGDGTFPNLLVNNFAARINSSANAFSVYNSTPSNPLFKIDGNAGVATFRCDLDVVGNASFVSVTNIDVESSMISLATNNVTDLLDIGFYGQYGDGATKYRGLVKSINLDRWVLFNAVTTEPSTEVDLESGSLDSLEVNNLYFGGIGDSLSALRTDVDGFPDSLKSLTADEISQLANIGSNAISNAEWGYLASLNQNVNTSSSPSWSGATFTGEVSLPMHKLVLGGADYPDDFGLYIQGANSITGVSPLIKFVNYLGTSLSSIGCAGKNDNLVTGSVDYDLVLKTETATANNIILAPGLNLALHANTDGNVTIGGANLAEDNYQLYVNGNAYFNNHVAISGSRTTAADARIAGLDVANSSSYDGYLNNVDGVFVNYGFGMPQNSNNHAATSGIRVSNNMNDMIGIVNNAYGLLVESGSALGAGGSCGTSYGGYFTQQSIGSTKCALYADNISVGFTASAPPANGALINGTLSVGRSSGYNTNKLYVYGPSYFTTPNSNEAAVAGFYSGNSDNHSITAFGRTEQEASIAVASSNNQFITGTTAGDLLIRHDSGTNRVWIGSNNTSGCFADVSADGGGWCPGSDNSQPLGKSGKRWSQLWAGTATISTSDINEKKNIQDSQLGLDFINQLTPCSFQYKEGNRRHYGLIAQEVKQVLDDNKINTVDFGGYVDPSITNPNDTGTKGLRYEEFISPIIKAIQELSNIVHTYVGQRDRSVP